MRLLIIIYYLIQLIIFTILAVVKNQYVEKPKPVGNIVGNAFKGLLLFWVVPIACITGLAVGNVVLRMVDEATSTQVGGSAGASDMLFIAAAYSANELRSSDNDYSDQREKLLEIFNDGKINVQLAAIGITSENDCKTASPEKLEQAATIVDTAFVNGVFGTPNICAFDRVFKYYNMFEFNYLIVWVGGVFLAYCLIIITWGLLGRIFKVVLLYCLSPAVLAAYPHDEGAAFKNWKGEFIKSATLGYTSVATLNIFYSVLPFVNQLELSSGVTGAMTNWFVRLCVMISGFMLIKDFMGTVSGWFGTGDAFGEGKNVKEKVTGKLKKGFSTVSGTFAGLKGGAAMAKSVNKNRFIGALSGMYSGSGLQDKFNPGKVVTDWRDAKKKGGEAYKNNASNWFGERGERNKALFEFMERQQAEEKLLNPLREELKSLEGKGDAESEARRSEILNKMKSISSYISTETKSIEADLERAKKVAEKQESHLELLDEYNDSLKAVEDMAKMLGLEVHELINGFSGLDEHGNKIELDDTKKAIYKQNFSEIGEVVNRAQKSQRKVARLAKSDAGFNKLIGREDKQPMSEALSALEVNTRTNEGGILDAKEKLAKDLAETQTTLNKKEQKLAEAIQESANKQKNIKDELDKMKADEREAFINKHNKNANKK